MATDSRLILRPALTIARPEFGLIMASLILGLLFCGYVLSTGMLLIESSVFKAAVRGLALLLAFMLLFSGRRISAGLLTLLFCALAFLILNQNIIAGNILYMLILLAGFRQVSNRHLSLAFLGSAYAAVSLHILAVITGIATITSTSIHGRTRSALGFANANQFALVYLTLVCSALLVHLQYRNKWSLTGLIGSVLLSLRMMQIADSRTSMASVLLLLLLLLTAVITSRTRIIRRLYALSLAALPAIAAAVTFFLATNPSPFLNIALSLRPAYFQAFLSNISLSQWLFGWIPAEDITIDNGYLILLSAVGLPVFLLLMLALCWRMIRLRPEILVIIAVVAIASIFESFALRPEIPLSILFFALIFRNWGRPRNLSHAGASA